MYEPEELMARIVDLEEQLKVSEMAPPAAEQLIACLEGEIAKRDARIVGLEQQVIGMRLDVITQVDAHAVTRAELAALKAQEPVARLPACPSRAFAVANLRDLAQSVLQHDPDVGMFRDEDQAFLINELADLAESFNGDVKLNAAPVSEAKAQGVVMPRDIEKSFLEWASAQLQAPTQLASYMAGADEVARLNAAPAAPAADAGKLADAFLSWKLPESVRPDGCAMDPTYPHRYGTNLMTWAQAKEMFEYVLAAHSANGVV